MIGAEVIDPHVEMWGLFEALPLKPSNGSDLCNALEPSLKVGENEKLISIK